MSDLLERLKLALADRYAIESEIGRGAMATVLKSAMNFGARATR